MLDKDPFNRVSARVMYDHYSHWCGSNGEVALDMKAFKQALIGTHNLTHKRTKLGSEWIGVKFRS
ncbi:hypothetical protein FXB40_23865 [Bradyrhizobium rifense]|uniref:DNA primase/nucleoside triphosphatase C-terminal domain-containing protein n=2 Tax=Bradyrhizobium rifense TaxID=515499 RepID=A0A5D3KAJ6_9BRAD|nr:hypothetical protein FXB40_23865 [Bradyrhizobium rifense]